MTVPPALVVHRALQALHGSDEAQLKRHLHPDVIYDTGDAFITGRDAVAHAIIAPQFEYLHMEIVPGRVEDHGDHLTAETRTVVRWKDGRQVADIEPQTLAIHLRDGVIARVELRPRRARPTPR